MKLTTIFISILIVLITGFSQVEAQSGARIITGIVTIEGEQTPLEGVTITVKGTRNSSGSQPDGIFYLEISPNDSLLVFSLQGFQTQEVAITHDTEYNVSLKRAPNLTLISARIALPQFHLNDKLINYDE